MPNNCLSVLYKHIIQVEYKNVGLKVGGTNIPLPPIKKAGGGACGYMYVYVFVHVCVSIWMYYVFLYMFRYIYVC